MMIDKAALRTQMHERRAGLSADLRSNAAGAVAAQADALLLQTGAAPRSCISIYWAIGPELDPAPLAAALASRGHTLCLPVMVGKAKPLVFRTYAPGDRVDLSAFRRDELMTVQVTLQPQPPQTCSLTMRDTPIDAKARRNAWLLG